MTIDGTASACAYRMKSAADDIASTPAKRIRASRIGCFKCENRVSLVWISELSSTSALFANLDFEMCDRYNHSDTGETGLEYTMGLLRLTPECSNLACGVQTVISTQSVLLAVSSRTQRYLHAPVYSLQATGGRSINGTRTSTFTL